MKKPTLEEVKEYFKNAIECKDWIGDKFNIELHNIVESNSGWVQNVFKENWGVLWLEGKGYAEILTTKEKTFSITESQIKEDEELWLPVFNYVGFYEVSNKGNVRSLSRLVNHSLNPEFKKNVFGRVLSKTLNPQGYNKVRLSMYGKKKTHLVYHLVSEAFLGYTERNSLECVDHIDEDKTNDNVSNLQIISKQENTKKSFDYKLSKFKPNTYWFHSTGELCLIFEITKHHGGTVKCKHISNDSDNFAYHGIGCMDREATEQEVFEALKNEAVKKGIQENIYVKLGKHINYLNKKGRFTIYNGLLLWTKETSNNGNGVILLKDGKWAEIIPTITLSEAEQQLGKKIIV